MATRTQKEAMKRKAEAAAKDKAKADKAAKVAAAKADKASKAAAAKAAKAERAAAAQAEAATPAKSKPAKPARPAKAKAPKGQSVAVKRRRAPAPKAEEALIEFQDASVPAAPLAAADDTPSGEHADNVAAELMRRRSKPIVLDAEDAPAPKLPLGAKAKASAAKDVLQLDPAPPAKLSEPAAPRGLSIPEHFILLALEDGWDERRERTGPDGLGGALVGALLLDLVLQGKVHVQRDRFTLTDQTVDAAAAPVAAKLASLASQPSLQVMRNLAKGLPQLVPAYKDRLQARGLIEHRAWRHLGLFYRSQTALLDADAQERLRSKLARAIAGGGRPDAPTILSLGLLEASGLFGIIVPEGAQAYNRKRLNGLVAGKDVMGYKVDDELRGVQEMAVRTILDNVRTLTRA